MMEFPVVQEQVIVQASLVVVGSLPPSEEFTEPVYNHFHQEQFSAGETTEIIPEIPVVQEQVIVQAISSLSLVLFLLLKSLLSLCTTISIRNSFLQVRRRRTFRISLLCRNR